MPFDQSRNMRVGFTGQEITFPMTGHRPVINLGRPLPARDRVLDLALPGMTASGEKDDYRINKQFQMMKFDGKRWVLFGPILTDTFKAQ